MLIKSVLLVSVLVGLSLGKSAFALDGSITSQISNPDGSVTLFEPKLEVEGAEALSIQNRSSLNGTCQHFGFRSGIFSTYETRGALPVYVRINSEGVVKKLQDMPSDEAATDYMETLICAAPTNRSKAHGTMGMGYDDKIVNSTGSVTFTNPLQNLPNLGWHRVWAKDDSALGVCHRLGFKTMESFALEERGLFGPTYYVDISDVGRVIKRRNFWHNMEPFISAVTCRN